MARKNCVFIDTMNSCFIGLPSGITDSFSKTSPSSCPLLDNSVVAFFFSVWLMARQDYVH